MSTTTIGDRLRGLREFRGLTQEELADRAGVSVSIVQKLEQNRRQSAHLSTLRALAFALDVELERLLGQPTVTQHQPDDGGLIALRDAIQDIGALPGVLMDGIDDDPPPPAEWMESARAATELYWQGEYSALSGHLPLLLREGRAVAREARGADVEKVWRQMALAYQLAASLATQAGHTSWAFVAVEKQLLAAQRASDPLLEGMGVSTLSWVLLRQGRWEEAQRVAERKADALEPGFRKGTKDQFAVYGNLLLAAATPAARRGQHTEAAAMLKAAEAAAVQSGPLRRYGTAFSVPDVRTQRVNIALAGDDPRPDLALRAARKVDVRAINRPVHRAAHRLDVAQAQYQTGNHADALETMLEVEGEQPEWIRYQVLAAATVRDMLESERRRNAELRGLAARLGVDPSV
ncbi:XRE family transcriptional regulator [Streptomyces sp. CB03234]|uniref:helix-turn-helix domain-containing protein n=1 Tax=Streptomyces sp. (strain CB03234) TaxID=1703937 RepID=UPI00093B1DC0|nr:helix-turn-helix transcriptional regulator [Streptomyces sp. CB03234]OKJ97022.1 XRE family transcriptional regulator [Streptomyces sp. CB03234]